ncbi:MAG: DNA-binding protein [Clostridia bacterium]|nr:DNA-binding protein [Clostridia bacterium]
MDYRRFGNTYLVRMDVGEEIIEQLKSLCRSENVRLAQVDAIGAVRQAVIGVYDLEEQAYHREDLEGFMEIAGLQGSVTRMNGEVYPHLHVTLAGQDNKVHAGHVIGLIVGATCEMFVRVLDGEVSRERDEEIGINTIRF